MQVDKDDLKKRFKKCLESAVPARSRRNDFLINWMNNRHVATIGDLTNVHLDHAFNLLKGWEAEDEYDRNQKSDPIHEREIRVTEKYFRPGTYHGINISAPVDGSIALVPVNTGGVTSTFQELKELGETLSKIADHLIAGGKVE